MGRAAANDDAPMTEPPRSTIALPWILAFACYWAAYAGAIHLGFGVGLAETLLLALVNCLPEAAAAPLVLALARRLLRPRSTRRTPRLGMLSGLVPLALGAAAFVLWSGAGATFGSALVRGFFDGVWARPVLSANLAWKALLDVMLYACLVAVGVAQAQARAARDAAERAERAERLRAEARLAVLRANLNPHFILNLLHSLMGLAERDPASTAAALERLGSALRFALRVQSRGMDLVPLREELDFARDYLALERVRLGDRLRVEISPCDPWLDRTVPSFVLQPLVENAIRHAIAPRAAGGTVAIDVRAEGEALVLTVDDDGAAEAAGPPGSPPLPGSPGIGLALLRDRLLALYGDGAALTLGRSPRGGFRAVVRLDTPPLREQNGDLETEEEMAP